MPLPMREAHDTLLIPEETLSKPDSWNKLKFNIPEFPVYILGRYYIYIKFNYGVRNIVYEIICVALGTTVAPVAPMASVATVVPVTPIASVALVETNPIIELTANFFFSPEFIAILFFKILSICY